MFARTKAVVSSTFSKVVPARHERISPFLLLAFLCGSFRQRKAAKPFWYQDLIDAFFFGIIATKKKALQKRNGVFSPTRRAVAFEKATQNNRTGECEQRADKSKFRTINR